jgi:prephenate dehydratase
MPIRVAIQGERGAFSDSAARKLLGADITIVTCRTFDDVFDSVKSGDADSAALPIENSLAGSVLRTYDLLGEHDVEIVAETLLPIRLALIAPPGLAFGEIRRVLSHPVALAQCQRFLGSMTEVEAVVAYDTAGSVKMIMESPPGGQDAAIASAEAADIYGATILRRDLEDHASNATRFVLIAARSSVEGMRQRVKQGPLKTTVLFRVANTPGALFRALAAFALRDINLTKLESRPIEGRPWEYAFYVDVNGGADEQPVTNALHHLQEMCDTVAVLGSYVAAETGI